MDKAKEHGVTIFSFPPHTTHLIQPLDVGVFGPLKQVWSRVLKEYKFETMGARVDKEVFPSLVAKMWPQVLLPEHLIGGFRAAGLHPLSREAITPKKLKTSKPFLQQEPPQSSTCTPRQTPVQHPPLPQLPRTPVTINIAKFFGDPFISQNCQVNIQQQASRQDRIEPRHYGEALTEDEFIERIRQQEEESSLVGREESRAGLSTGTKERGARTSSERERERERERAELKAQKQAKKQQRAEKQEKQKKKRQRKEHCDENVCQGCREHYDEDEEESKEGWIGCDERGCWRWYHYWCAGLFRLQRYQLLLQ